MTTEHWGDIGPAEMKVLVQAHNIVQKEMANGMSELQWIPNSCDKRNGAYLMSVCAYNPDTRSLIFSESGLKRVVGIESVDEIYISYDVASNTLILGIDVARTGITVDEITPFQPFPQAPDVVPFTVEQLDELENMYARSVVNDVQLDLVISVAEQWRTLSAFFLQADPTSTKEPTTLVERANRFNPGSTGTVTVKCVATLTDSFTFTAGAINRIKGISQFIRNVDFSFEILPSAAKVVVTLSVDTPRAAGKDWKTPGPTGRVFVSSMPSVPPPQSVSRLAVDTNEVGKVGIRGTLGTASMMQASSQARNSRVQTSRAIAKRKKLRAMRKYNDADADTYDMFSGIAEEAAASASVRFALPGTSSSH